MINASRDIERNGKVASTSVHSMPSSLQFQHPSLPYPISPSPSHCCYVLGPFLNNSCQELHHVPHTRPWSVDEICDFSVRPGSVHTIPISTPLSVSCL